MPVDIDELFTALGRQADALPLGPAESARRAGDQRTRTQRTVAVAAALLLVAAGLGIAALRRDHAPEPILPATKIRGIAPVGSPLHIHGPASKSMFSSSVVIGDRVIIASGNIDNSLEVIGVDTRTGAEVWNAGRIEAFETNGPVAVPGAVLIAEGSALRVHDPRTGRKLWEVVSPRNGDIVVDGEVLVRVNEGGVTEGFALATGARLWSAPAGADRPRLTTGVVSGPAPTETAGRRIHSSDGRFAQITLGGRVLFRDMRTGDVLKSVATPVRPRSLTSFSAFDNMAVIGDNSGYTDKPSRLLTVDAETGKAGVLHSIRSGSLRPSFRCGPRQLCVISHDGDPAPEKLTAYDLTTRKVRWSVENPAGLLTGSVRGGRLMVTGLDGTSTIYDVDGTRLHQTDNGSASARTGWIDDDNVLSSTPNPDGGHTLVSVSVADGSATTLGALSRWAGGCSWNSEILACRDDVELKIWRFTR